MSNKLWLCVPIAGFALLGCAAMHEQLAAGCTRGGCKVDVTITNCAVSTSPYDLVVPLPRGLKKIHWDIVTDGYVFAANGIVITKPGVEFEQPELSANGKKFKWDNKHMMAGKYKYSVNVVSTGLNPRNCPTYDPWISNQ